MLGIIQNSPLEWTEPRPAHLDGWQRNCLTSRTRSSSTLPHDEASHRSRGEPDLFSSAPLSEAPSPGVKPPRKAPSTDITTVPRPQYLLPKDLSSGIRQLTDQEFDRLLAAVLAEQKRRGKKLSVSRNSRKPPVQNRASSDPRKTQCCTGCLQGRRPSIAHCETVWNFPCGRSGGAGKWSV